MRINGKKLKDIIYRRGVSLRRFSIENGFHNRWIYQVIANGGISEEYLYRLANALDIEPNELKSMLSDE